MILGILPNAILQGSTDLSAAIRHQLQARNTVSAGKRLACEQRMQAQQHARASSPAASTTARTVANVRNRNEVQIQINEHLEARLQARERQAAIRCVEAIVFARDPSERKETRLLENRRLAGMKSEIQHETRSSAWMKPRQ